MQPHDQPSPDCPRVGQLYPRDGATDRRELLRASVGVGLAILLCDLCLWMIRHLASFLPGGMGSPLTEIILVSPFAATAFLNLTVPNSPLAQPWSVVVANTLGTAAGVLCFALLPFPILAAALSVALAVLAMAWLRALHPLGAAMALNTVLLSQGGADTGPAFVIATVTAGSVVLAIFGALFNSLTGRRYPFRQPQEALAREAACLADILERLRLSATIGVADLSRLIVVAETEATAHHLGHQAAASMKTKKPFALPPEADLEVVRAAFRDHPFRAIPVTKADGSFCGLILQNAMLDAEGDATAAKVMDKVPTLAPEAELPAIMPLLTQGNCRVVPVVDQDRLVGVITWSDLIRLLSRSLREGQN